MNFNLNNKIIKISFFGSFLLISSCASLEPGMRLAANPPQIEISSADSTPLVKLITPELLYKERNETLHRSTQDISSLFAETKAYIIGNGDLLGILVWDHPELNIAAAGAQALSSSSIQSVAIPGAQTPSAYVVDQDGLVQFPYVGAIRLAGMTELNARNALATALSKSIKQPNITLRVLSFRSKKVYVDGEVRSPGNQPIDDVPMSLLESLTRAGGMLPTADQSYIAITRNGISYPINLPLLVKNGVNPSKILLNDGDVVRVRSRDENKVYVLGEVLAPKALPMINGKMTLTEALGEAGGLNQLSASAKQVYVVRNVDGPVPTVYNLDAQSPVALALADSFELSPRDVIFVDASGLARFNRILNLILPNSANITSSYNNVKR